MEVAPQKIPLSRWTITRVMRSFTWIKKATVSTSAQNLWKKRIAPKPPTPLARPRAQMLSLKRSGNPVAANPRKLEKSAA